VDWRRAERQDESRSPQWWAERASHEPRPDELAARADMATTLYASVDKLEPDLRHTIHLHYYQELTLQETADVMGVAASTVKYRLRLALKELQKHLAAERSALSSSTISKAI
jgi:RNA polymerase sigma factor (sigma-70 family)